MRVWLPDETRGRGRGREAGLCARRLQCRAPHPRLLAVMREASSPSATRCPARDPSAGESLPPSVGTLSRGNRPPPSPRDPQRATGPRPFVKSNPRRNTLNAARCRDRHPRRAPSPRDRSAVPVGSVAPARLRRRWKGERAGLTAVFASHHSRAAPLQWSARLDPAAFWEKAARLGVLDPANKPTTNSTSRFF